MCLGELNMSNITPEMLKVVALGMGYEDAEILRSSVIIAKSRVSDTSTVMAEYNPLTNAEQCMEIMEKLRIDLEFWADSVDAIINKHNDNADVITRYGKTINEAVVNAAFEYFNTQTDVRS